MIDEQKNIGEEFNAPAFKDADNSGDANNTGSAVESELEMGGTFSSAKPTTESTKRTVPIINLMENKPEAQPASEASNGNSPTYTPTPVIKNEDERVSYFLISNIILSQACNAYVTAYDEYLIPGSFIRFYIKELSSYNQSFTNQISNFMTTFFKNEDTETKLVLEMFCKAFPTYAKKIVKREKQWGLMLDKINCDMRVTYEISSGDAELLETKSQLEKMLKHYENNDELFTIKELYSNYARMDEIQDLIAEKTKVQQESEVIVEITEKNTIINKYDGKETAIVEQTGKVTKVRVPKFELPIKYPLSRTKSLIHKHRNLQRFLEPADTILFINNQEITKVRENQHFIDKRKALLTPQKSKYASFLDNF